MKKLLALTFFISTISYASPARVLLGSRTLVEINGDTETLWFHPALPGDIQHTAIRGGTALAALISLKALYNTTQRDDFGANGKTISRLGLIGLGLSGSVYCFLNAHKLAQ